MSGEYKRTLRLASKTLVIAAVPAHDAEAGTITTDELARFIL